MSFNSVPSLLTFDQFFDRYPRAIDRVASKAAWDELNPSLAIQREIVDALQWQSKLWLNTAAQYIPTPSNYLLKERYRDKPPLHLRPKVAKPLVAANEPKVLLSSLHAHIKSNPEVYRKGLEFLPAARKYLSQQTLSLIDGVSSKTDECPW